jgi:pantoate--beta-alanine ligase
MILVRTIAEVRRAVREVRDHGERIGLVPTMGFLHRGHLSLIDVARAKRASFVVVSIFVNPMQFGPREDFHSYPRDEARDAQLLREKQVDLLFVPSVETMVPPGSTTRVLVGPVAQPLEGERRPGHFEGVATVLAKLFNIVEPDLAVFGQKDAQQCAVVRQLVRDLDIPVELHFGKTVREEDGLAMSSRNANLSVAERKIAPALHRALLAGRSVLLDGNQEVHRVEQAMREALGAGAEPDYLQLVDPETFLAPTDLRRDLLLVGAVRVGKTRLIDNIPIARQELRR